MGIRFYCPEGHKLNVKSFLAGKMGFCPHCDARVQIPLTSTRPSSKALHDKPMDQQTALPLASPLEDWDEVLPDKVVEPIAAEGFAASPGQSPAEAEQDSRSPSPQSPPPVQSTVPLVGNGDPLTVAPDAQWYVCPEVGGQNYGPATAELMRQWLEEGRVLPDHLVWREGWNEWQRAGACFLHLDGQVKQD